MTDNAFPPGAMDAPVKHMAMPAVDSKRWVQTGAAIPLPGVAA